MVQVRLHSEKGARVSFVLGVVVSAEEWGIWLNEGIVYAKSRLLRKLWELAMWFKGLCRLRVDFMGGFLQAKNTFVRARVLARGCLGYLKVLLKE